MNTSSTDHILNADAQPPWRLPAFLKRFDILPFLLIHMACLAVFFTGVSSLALVLCGACHAVRVFAITAGYHRYFSHRAYKTSRAFSSCSRVSGAVPVRRAHFGGFGITATTTFIPILLQICTRQTPAVSGGPTSAGSFLEITMKRTGRQSRTGAAIRNSAG